ncbi:ricin-type beta-trefoil lectin domain protein [Embleya sp. NPDC008237]|uniref:ricin-type beta-trefoil lectin domain protein n=1 Tax=Embleya sp. NPDC008237 TaxID=3363978 RepID=UPI0036F167E3
MKVTGKRRISLVAAIAATAAIVGGLQLSGSAFGDQSDQDAKPTAEAPAPTQQALEGLEPPDSGWSDVDGTAFVNGRMTIPAVGPARQRASMSAAAAAPSGPGWKSAGATKLLSTGYTIKFYDQKSVDWLGPYVKRSAAEIQRDTALPIKVDTKPVGHDYVRPKGEIVIGAFLNPCVTTTDGSPWKIVMDGSGTPGWSCGFHSRSTPDTVTSGHAYINTSFFTTDGKPIARFGEVGMRNHISHELGHTLGLAHADDAPKTCVKGTDSGETPVMCSVVNAYPDSRAGQYVQQFDVQGLRSLAAAAGAPVSPQGKVTGIAGKCLDVKGGKPANGTQIQIYTCNTGPGQSWILHPDGTLRSMGKCLDDARNASTEGNKISLWDCNASAAQKWKLDAKGRIVHVASGKVLDVKGGSTANSTVVQLHSANAGKGQLWNVPK